jgi:hypothetical protein
MRKRLLWRCTKTIRTNTYAAIFARFTSCTRDGLLLWAAQGHRRFLTIRDVAEMQLVVPLRRLSRQALDPRRRTGDVAEKAHLTPTAAIGNRHRVLRLRPACMRLGSVPPEQPSFLYRTKGRAAGPSLGS